MDWNGKPHHSLDCELKQQFGQKVYKLSLSGGMTCLNRDGTLGTGGCIFYSAGGSGNFASPVMESVTAQIEAAKAQVRRKMTGKGAYIAYFQSCTSTYGPISRLRSVSTEAIYHPEIAVLPITTRPDCLEPEVVELLKELAAIKPVWVELGLQTIHQSTTQFIRRGYPPLVLESAVDRLKKAGLTAIVHVILGLPGETREMMLDTVRYLAEGITGADRANSGLAGISPAVSGRPGAGQAAAIDDARLQLLHILEGTDLSQLYHSTPFPVLEMSKYIDLVIDCVELLPPEMTIHRITGDGPEKLLIIPLQSGNKRLVLSTLHQCLRKRDTWQGKNR